MIHSLAEQAFALRERFPKAKTKLSPTQLVWTAPIQPTPGSREYIVRITYALRKIPLVRVVKPELEARPGEELPHTYGDGSLCLHKREEWMPDMLIVESTLPWTAEWLFFYEIWRSTGEWLGGGEWPPTQSPEPTSTDAKSGAANIVADAVSDQTQEIAMTPQTLRRDNA